MMRIVPLAAALAALTGGLAAPVAQAAFPGRNGVVAGGWEYADDALPGTVVHAVRAFDDGRPYWEPGTLLVGCSVVSGSPEAVRGCRDRAFGFPSFSADGDRIAFAARGSIGIADLSDESVSQLPNPPGSATVSAPVFSPDGRRIAFVGPGGIWTAATDGTRQAPLISGSQPDWSSGGWIAFRRGGQLFRIRPNGSGLRQLTRRGGSSPSWAPGGRKLAFLREGGVHSLDVATGRVVREVPDRAFGGPAFQVRWSPDGSAFALLSEYLVRWDRGTRRATRMFGMVEADHVEYSHHLNGIAWQPRR